MGLHSPHHDDARAHGERMMQEAELRNAQFKRELLELGLAYHGVGIYTFCVPKVGQAVQLTRGLILFRKHLPHVEVASTLLCDETSPDTLRVIIVTNRPYEVTDDA